MRYSTQVGGSQQNQDSLEESVISKPEQYFLFYPSFSQGGAEQLIMRVARKMKNKGYDVSIGVFQCSDEMRLEIEKLNLKFVVIKGGYDAYIYHLKLLSANYQVRVITFFWTDYLYVRSLQAKYGIVSILYVLQRDILSQKRLKIGRKLRRWYGKGIKRLADTRRIVFMDEEAFVATFDSYELDFAFDESVFVRIPFEIDESEFVHHPRSKGFKILAIARAEFPFKGYLFGLIDFSKSLHSLYPGLSLVLVSCGPGFGDLQRQVESCDFIELVGETPHDDLVGFYKTANMYFGMGTTLLEAANMCLPSVAVESYTYELKTSSLFNEEPRCLSANNSSRTVDPYELTRKIIEMPEIEYSHLCEVSKHSLSETYDCDKSVNMLIRSFDSQVYENEIIFSLECSARKVLSKWRRIRGLKAI